MNNELKIFENAEFGSIRTVEIDSTPYFVGKDVAEVLGYAKARNALAAHVDDEDKKDAPIQGDLGGTQNMTIINESGLYSLILSSKLPKAKEFKHWVTSVVLPAIRKTGAYSKKLQSTELAKIRADAMMLNAKSRTAKQMMELWTAAGVKPEYQALALNGYYDGLELPRTAFKEQATVLYDATTIADHLGILSKSNKPHAQAVGAIIEKLKPLDDNEWAMTPYSRNGHDSESIQYALSVEQKVSQWLKDNDYPTAIQGNDKTFTVILMGDSLDFDELYRRLYDEALGHEVYWREFYENRNNELERKLNRIETEKKT